MAHKKHRKGPAPVPPGNRPQGGPVKDIETPEETPKGGAGFQEQDPKRRLGNFTGAGEHAYQQPGGSNDANRH